MTKIDAYLSEKKPNETFVLMMLRLIHEKGYTESDFYKKAMIDRKLFSKFKSNINYKPSKKTVCKIALALELDNKTSKQLIKKAGYILTAAKKFDLIIRFCFENQIYDFFKINDLLEEQGLDNYFF